MLHSVTLDDVVQDQSGYAVLFTDGYTVCVEQYDDLKANALDTLERYANDVLRAALILRWVASSKLNETASIGDGGSVNNLG